MILFFEIKKKNKLLAGESDIDQIYRIQKCLGPLPPKYTEAMKTSPKFANVKVFEKYFS
jgi:cyclin-dependent kinase-like